MKSVEKLKPREAPAGCEGFRTRHRADVAFIVTMAGRIVQMQSGFAMLESAYARA